MTLLVTGLIVSILDFVLLYGAARKDGVLYITGGVGLLQNYGLLSTVFANCIVAYLAKKFCVSVSSIGQSKAVSNASYVEPPLSLLTDMMRMRRQYKFLIYLLVTIGACFWLSNLSFHLIGNPQARWGHKVFDSTDHRLTFFASRLHNLYTWLVVWPLLGHAMIFATVQLRGAIALADRKGVLRYDLLNPDQKGGFLFVDKAHLAFNVVIALIYIQISMHVETFARMNVEHAVAYAFATLFLLGGNRLFLGDIYSTIYRLKIDALDVVKEKVYKDDKLSFEILKYCYERRVDEFSLVNFAVKASALLVSTTVKLWPLLSKAFT